MSFNPRRSRVWTPRTEDRLKTSWFQPSDETMKEQEQILANMYFLVRQGSEFGERLRCGYCNGRHDYITMLCVPKPITGLAGGLYAYYRAVKDLGAEAAFNDAQRNRINEIHDLLSQMPDLSKVHPEFSRKVVIDIGPKDMALGAASLGILEPISPTDARRFADKINEKGVRPRFELVPANRAEVDRALEYSGPKFTRSRW